MTDQLLLSYACEMLSRTNPYQKGVESFHYHCSQKDEISLLSLIDNHPDIRGHRMSSDKRLGKQKNIRTCFRAISNAMVTYMKSYPAASSCKSRMKEKFVLWLEAIRKEYQITDTDCSIPEALYPAEGEKDTVVMLLKSLQARGGITKKELQDVVYRITAALKPGGIFYTSFKYGNFEGIRGSRYFTDFTEESLTEFWSEFHALKITELWITQDVRPGREEERWINLLARRV